ncbi:putative U-box domain-containing protein 42 isoform X2 [Ananas comosus]|nr:putative U-box domain-containing protein 42 isoform X2 [Ananas comosus]
MSSVVDVDTEQETFMELGSYLHRTSPAIMELRNSPENATEILKSLNANVSLAKELVAKCSSGAQSIADGELKGIIQQLEEVIRNIGESLSKIPASTFRNCAYAEIAIRSLSKEMREARLQANGTRQENRYAEIRESQEDGTVSVQNSNLVSRKLSSKSGEEPRLIDFLKGVYYSGEQESGSGQLDTLPQLAQLAEYVEPLYETFFCPITKKIMDDPVTIESGVTYERKAIAEWFEKTKDDSEGITCPATKTKLQSTALNTNLAIKSTILEWIERNEATRIRVARTALSLATSEAMVLDAIRDLKFLSEKKRSNREKMHGIGITKLLTRYLENDDAVLRLEALELLCLLVENEEGKVIIGKTRAISRAIKMLSRINTSEKHAALSFLLELSKSDLLLEKIGSVVGGILILITMKFNESADPFASEKSGEILKNLERCPINIKRMAENGFLDPLLNNLVEGTEDTQMEMVSYLGELALEQDMKISVAENASETLIKMVQSGNSMVRKAAFGALVQISSYHANSKALVEAGVVPIMIEEMFTRKIHNEPMESKDEAAAILANILESNVDLESLQINKHGHTITSHYSIYNITHMLKCSVPDELNTNLVKMLLSLSKLPKALSTIVSVTRETEVICTVVEFLNAPSEELTVVAAKLLITLSSHSGHTIADGLCKTRGQPESLIKNFDHNSTTEKHAVSANLLAKLPHRNVTLNLALLEQGAVPIILDRIQVIQRGETRTSRYAKLYVEGLVGILVRFTATLYDADILQMAMEQNLTSVFVELLVRTSGSDEVQRLAAVGLANLSSESISLSKQPDATRQKKKSFLPKSFSLRTKKEDAKGQRIQLCPVHKGVCSASATFCLLDSRAVERLLGCLEHENPKVVEAALSALSTLLDERVDVEKSVGILSEVDGVRHVLRILREHKEQRVWQKSFWVIEKFLANGDDRSFRDISSDRVLPSALLTAFHRGDGSTKQAAENVLRHLKKMPEFSGSMIL